MYENLKETIEVLALDNGTTSHITTDWDTVFNQTADLDLVELDMQAGRLDSYEKELLCAGDGDDIATVVAAHNCQLLSDFIAEVFDGKYTRFVFPSLGN